MIKLIPDKFLYLFCASVIFVLLNAAESYSADGPALPEGLLSGASEQNSDDVPPGLPAGLGLEAVSDGSENPGPSLPSGLLPGDNQGRIGRQEPERTPWLLPVTGFLESRAGMRLYDDSCEKDASIGEIRFQAETEKQLGRFLIRNTTDFYYDGVLEEYSVNLEEGEGFIDLRELSVSFSALSFLDIKAGRQILTWGTGDLVFINDLFPKDWQSFLIGRDTEYLKAPSDAFKASIFTDVVNIDIVYTPKFDPDRFITGERLSYWNGRRISGRDSLLKADRPDDWFEDDEWALRISKNIKGNEFALYGYRGYWKSPGGMDASTLSYIFPKLNVYGASVRGQIGNGIGNIEVGCYDSRDDHGGNNPFINNSQLRFLVGYEQDLPKLATDFTLGLQYYLEYMMDYDDYLLSLPDGSIAADEDRHLFTVRLTKLYLNQNLTLSLFTYYSPSDQDIYMRPNINYKINDYLEVELGANLFMEEDSHTFFGQFHDNTNVFMAVRYNY